MRTYGYSMVPLNNEIVPVLMPYYTAETENSLERGSRPYSVVEILREVFKEDFKKAIQSYMDTCPQGAAKAIGVTDAQDFRLTWLSEPKVESSLMQPACTMAVDLLFRVSLTAIVSSTGNGTEATDAEDAAEPVDSAEAVMEKKYFTANYRVRYMIRLWEKRCSAPIIAPVDYFPQDMITEQKTAITNQYLLPIMYAEDYAKTGRRMLKRYYPEALEKPTAVDGMELASRMNLTVRKVRFEEESNIQGRIYFDWTWVKLRDRNGNVREERIPPMTILVNIDNCTTSETENSTTVHECCHVFLDMPFFKLQMLSGKPFASFTSRKRKKKKYAQINSPIDWMELQAEKLPAYVLMEEETTRREIERLLDIRNGVRSPENMHWILNQLAMTFKVSKSMAKYRMIELGYQEAEGVYNFIDHMSIPDYGCGGLWERGITYLISLSEAGALLNESSRFADAVQSGKYAYVEGHYCLDMEDYIQLDYRRNKRLTAYARHNIERCCIAFTVWGRYTNAEYEDAQAAKMTPVKNKYWGRHDFSAEPETKQWRKENRMFSTDAEAWNELILTMPDTLKEAVKKTRKLKGISQDELAMRLGVSRAAYQKWYYGAMTKQHIIAICIALEVRADIGLELVRLGGYALLHNEEDDLLTAMLYDTHDLTVGRANDILRQKNLEPLTKGKDEELACCC